MKMFDRDGKFNWVDDKNCVVGYDSGQNCCELFDYRYLDKDKVVIKLSDEQLECYNFCPSFHESSRLIESDDELLKKRIEQGEAIIIALFKMEIYKGVNVEEVAYLELRNCHNGYYSHGFEMLKDGEVLHSGKL